MLIDALCPCAGWLHVPAALSADELRAAKDASTELFSMGPGDPRLPAGFAGRSETQGRIGNAIAFDRSLESLAFHPAIWPIVMELTNGKPKLKHATLLRDDNSGDLGYKAGGGGHLHCAKEDWGRESASFETLVGPSGTTLYTSAFLVFVYLDDVLPGDGGLLVLPGATPHPQPPTIHRPPDSFRH